MKLAKDFRASYMLAFENPDVSATTVSAFLRSDWDESAKIVNDRQSGVILYGDKKSAGGNSYFPASQRQGIFGVLVPPSFVYEYVRTLPTTLYSDPIIHTDVADFKKHFHERAEALDMDTSLVVVDDTGAPLLAMMGDVRANALLQFDAQGKVDIRTGEPLFSAEGFTDLGEWSRHDHVKLSEQDTDRIFQAVDVLSKAAEKGRDVMHRAIRNLHFDLG